MKQRPGGQIYFTQSGPDDVSAYFLSNRYDAQPHFTFQIIKKIKSTHSSKPETCFVLEGSSQGIKDVVSALPKVEEAFELIRGVALLPLAHASSPSVDSRYECKTTHIEQPSGKGDKNSKSDKSDKGDKSDDGDKGTKQEDELIAFAVEALDQGMPACNHKRSIDAIESVSVTQHKRALRNRRRLSSMLEARDATSTPPPPALQGGPGPTSGQGGPVGGSGPIAGSGSTAGGVGADKLASTGAGSGVSGGTSGGGAAGGEKKDVGSSEAASSGKKSAADPESATTADKKTSDDAEAASKKKSDDADKEKDKDKDKSKDDKKADKKKKKPGLIKRLMGKIMHYIEKKMPKVASLLKTLGIGKDSSKPKTTGDKGDAKEAAATGKDGKAPPAATKDDADVKKSQP